MENRVGKLFWGEPEARARPLDGGICRRNLFHNWEDWSSICNSYVEIVILWGEEGGFGNAKATQCPCRYFYESKLSRFLCKKKSGALEVDNTCLLSKWLTCPDDHQNGLVDHEYTTWFMRIHFAFSEYSTQYKIAAQWAKVHLKVTCKLNRRWCSMCSFFCLVVVV